MVLFQLCQLNYILLSNYMSPVPLPHPRRAGTAGTSPLVNSVPSRRWIAASCLASGLAVMHKYSPPD